jgi:hypothetical protein
VVGKKTEQPSSDAPGPRAGNDRLKSNAITFVPKCRELASSGIRKRLVDVSDLPRGSRWLVIFAYISLALLLAATSFFELFAGWLSYVD